MYGFNTVSLDKKGRLAIPAKYRSHLINNSETKIIITKDPQYPSLKVYPESQWYEISNKLESLQSKYLSLNPINFRKVNSHTVYNSAITLKLKIYA